MDRFNKEFFLNKVKELETTKIGDNAVITIAH